MPAKTVIHFLTSNPLKFRRAKSVFESASIELLKLTPTSPEIQADTPLEIAKYGAKLEANIHNFPVLREDHGLYIEGFMNEKFPGPYAAYWDTFVQAEELLKILYRGEAEENRTGYFELGAYLAFPDGTGLESVSRVKIEFSQNVRGNIGNLDRIFMLPGSEKTFAESNSEERDYIFQENFRNIRLLLSRCNSIS